MNNVEQRWASQNDLMIDINIQCYYFQPKIISMNNETFFMSCNSFLMSKNNHQNLKKTVLLSFVQIKRIIHFFLNHKIRSHMRLQFPQQADGCVYKKKKKN